MSFEIKSLVLFYFQVNCSKAQLNDQIAKHKLILPKDIKEDDTQHLMEEDPFSDIKDNSDTVIINDIPVW